MALFLTFPFLFRSLILPDEEVRSPSGVMITGHEGQMAFEDESLQQQLDFIALDQDHGSHASQKTHHKCDRKGCTVGRNQAKRSSWFRQKIHFVDVSKLRQPKLCMKAHLVGDDCKPLLIKAGEDVTVPLVNGESFAEEKRPKKATNCGKCALLLDALARTFCLPLLG